jgi:hypothetical protein
MSLLATVAKMLGVRPDQAEDALRDEGRAQQAVRLSRRGFFAAGACMAAAPLVPRKVYGFLFEPALAPISWEYLTMSQSGLLIGGLVGMAVMYQHSRALALEA